MGVINRLWKWNAQAPQACQVVLNSVYQWNARMFSCKEESICKPLRQWRVPRSTQGSLVSGLVFIFDSGRKHCVFGMDLVLFRLRELCTAIGQAWC